QERLARRVDIQEVEVLSEVTARNRADLCGLVAEAAEDRRRLINDRPAVYVNADGAPLGVPKVVPDRALVPGDPDEQLVLRPVEGGEPFQDAERVGDRVLAGGLAVLLPEL